MSDSLERVRAALDAAGVARVLNPFTDAADYAARSLLEELGGERTGGLQ